MSRIATCTVSLYWDERVKRWAAVARRDGMTAVRTLTIDTTADIDEVGTLRILAAIEDEMMRWLPLAT